MNITCLCSVYFKKSEMKLQGYKVGDVKEGVWKGGEGGREEGGRGRDGKVKGRREADPYDA